MDSYFTATRKTSKASIITTAMATSKLTATSLDAAIVEAKQIADAEVGTVEVRYVMGSTSSHLKTVRPSKQAVREYAEWLAQRGGRA